MAKQRRRKGRRKGKKAVRVNGARPETNDGGSSKPQRVLYEPWKTQHQNYLDETKHLKANPSRNNRKHGGRDIGKEVLVFPLPLDELPTEEYDALMTQATKVLGLRDRYSVDLPNMLIEHMALGGTLEAFCGKPEVGVTHDTFWRWLKTYVELRVAAGVGKALAQRYWEGIGGDSMFLPDGVKFNMAGWRMVMMNRFGYKDKLTHAEDDGEEVSAVPVLQKKYRSLDNLDAKDLKQLRTLLSKMELDEQPPEPKQIN